MKQHVIIFKLSELYKILNELKNHLNFEIFFFSEKKNLLDFKKSLKNYLILTNSLNEVSGEKFQLIIDKFPETINSLVEKININLLKQKYLEQSDILIGDYSVDLNSRKIKKNKTSLKLTEREIEIILFLKNSKGPKNIENLQKEVWGHISDLETHTVETHIYRLRKKIFNKFNDENFINSTKHGYKIK